ncbi:MAG: pyroglutamyl-peptidase I [Myxococcales bacterium]|nr:pyroglutamyl-peptidase I [Myxococcales bacterium]
MRLITGFEPFISSGGLHLDVNPTDELARRVAADAKDVAVQILPVSFERTRTCLLDAFHTTRPRVWLGLGFAPHRLTIDIESVALNIEHCMRPDNDGDMPSLRPIVANAPTAYQTKLDIPEACQRLSKFGLDARASVHAGGFLCNQSFFLGCHTAATESYLEVAVFIHIPPRPDYGPLTAGLVDLIEHL